jgi:O-antigen/teichoic acid export membrane protein
MEASIKRDYIWNTIGVLAQNAISPLLLIAVTRINGIYDSGLFSFAFSVAIIFWVLGMWGGRTYQVSDVTREFSHRSYVMVRLLLAVCMVVGAIIFVWANGYDADKSSIIMALVLFKAMESIADAIHGVLQVHERLYIVGKSLIYKAISGFVLFIIIDLITHNILLSCLGIVFANVIVTLLYDVRIAGKVSTESILPQYLRKTAKSAVNIMTRTWPVFIVIFLSMFSLNIPRYFIDLYHQEQIGYFGILAMPITLIGLVMTFILQPKVVQLSKQYEEKKYGLFNQTINKLIAITIGIGFITMLGAYILGVPVLGVVFGIDFSQYQTVLMIIVAGAIINAIVSIFINIFIIIRAFKHQFYTLLVTNIFLVLLSAMFVKQYGLLGGVTLFTAINLMQVISLFIGYKYTLAKAARTNH